MGWRRRGFGLRKTDQDGRAAALLALNGNVSVGLLDEAIHHAEAEPGALADVLCRVERLEYLTQIAGCDAVAGVGERDHHIFAGGRAVEGSDGIVLQFDVGGFDAELAAIRHGIAGVQRKIEDRGRQLARIDQCRRNRFARLEVDADEFADRRFEKLHGVDDQCVDIDTGRLQRLLARKGQQMLGQGGAAGGGIVDQLCNSGQLGPVGHRIGQDFDRSRDHSEDVVEVVRDASGQLADRLHLLDLSDLGLRRLGLAEALQQRLGAAPLLAFFLERDM